MFLVLTKNRLKINKKNQKNKKINLRKIWKKIKYLKITKNYLKKINFLLVMEI